MFHLHNFSFEFLEIPFIKDNNNNSTGWYGGPKLEFNTLFPRFIYKTYLIIGIFSIFTFFDIFKRCNQKIKLNEIDNVILLFIIFINLFLFWFMPAKILLINPFIIVTYILFFKYLDNKKIYFLIFLILFSGLFFMI